MGYRAPFPRHAIAIALALSFAIGPPGCASVPAGEIARGTSEQPPEGRSTARSTDGAHRDPAEARPAYPWLGNESYDPLSARVLPPSGFRRVPAAPDSFGAWLRNLPLRRGRPQVRLHDGRLKANQQAHWAVVLVDVGSRDLQQCADAVIRLRAEYLFQRGLESEIAFRFTSGDLASWPMWRDGKRPVVGRTHVVWSSTAARDGSHRNFRRYLDTVFRYAGTASLARELEPVSDPARVEIGNVFVRGGNPGHAVLVVDVAENAAGDRVFLLLQSFMPAQEMHILRRPGSAGSPWYDASADGPVVTPEWTFERTQLRRFPGVSGGEPVPAVERRERPLP